MNFGSGFRRRRALAALLPLALLGGCESQLALQDPYFEKTAARVAAHGAEVDGLLRYQRALAAVRTRCLALASTDGRSGAAGLPAAGDAALAELCAASRAPSPEARGAILGAYRRWLADDIRELPEAGATGAGAAGG